MINFIKKLLREGLNENNDCHNFFDLDSLKRYVEFDMPLYSMVEKHKTAKLLSIPPQQYIYRIAQGFGGLTWADVVDGPQVSKENVKKYSLDMLKGDKFPIPYYTKDGDYQEGRHRALAAMEIGCESIPVIEFIKLNNSDYNNMLKKFKGKSIEELDEIFKRIGFDKGVSVLGYRALQLKYDNI
jgi:hypothetical protein